MAPTPFEVHPYSLDVLKRLLTDAAQALPELVDSKSHVAYLNAYLKHKGVKTVLLERDYIDRDYLEDYSGYYVRCFRQKDKPEYGPRCNRLHFFSRNFTEDDFKAVLSKSSTALTKDELQTAYVGFQVVKPLPVTFIGRTCLLQYEPGDDDRQYPISRKYDVNLFGLKLYVDSLAFQEQDRVVAACATSALWSAFQGTGKMFQHAIPSPFVITKSATDAAPIWNRVMPNLGLSVTMMTHAIRHIGLEPFAVYQIKDTNFHLLKSTVYAYLQAEIPVILGIHLQEKRLFGSNKAIDFHAVTIAGYSTGLKEPVPYQESEFLLRSTRIDTIYVHDDQVGPFARMYIGTDSLSTELMKDGEKDKIVAAPEVLLIPLYHKIRIPFITIHGIVNRFDQFFRGYMKKVPNGQNLKIEWDIYLTTVGKYKESLLKQGLDNSNELTRVLTHPLPKYIWIATASIGGVRQMDLLFDATNIEQGHLFIDAVQHTDYFDPTLRIICKSPARHTTEKTLLAGIQPILRKFAPDEGA